MISRQAKFLGKLIPETGWCVTERAVVDLQRGRGRWAREGYDIWWTSGQTERDRYLWNENVGTNGTQGRSGMGTDSLVNIGKCSDGVQRVVLRDGATEESEEVITRSRMWLLLWVGKSTCWVRLNEDRADGNREVRWSLGLGTLKTREWKTRECEKYGKWRFQKCVSDCIDWAHHVETDSNVTAEQRLGWVETTS